MTAWIAWALALPAFAALSCAMERHQDQVVGRELPPRICAALRVAGVLLLIASLALCVTAWSASVATVAWLGVLTFAALGVGLTLTYAPRRLPWVSGVALTAAAAAWLARL